MTADADIYHATAPLSGARRPILATVMELQRERGDGEAVN
jgi:hypothetical protein